MTSPSRVSPGVREALRDSTAVLEDLLAHARAGTEPNWDRVRTYIVLGKRALALGDPGAPPPLSEVKPHAELERIIMALRLELPASVIDDVARRLRAIVAVPSSREERMAGDSK